VKLSIVIKVKLSVGLINPATGSGAVSGDMAPLFLNSALDGDVGSFMLQLFYSQEHSPWYTL
jgi:hypothetical protein